MTAWLGGWQLSHPSATRLQSLTWEPESPGAAEVQVPSPCLVLLASPPSHRRHNPKLSAAPSLVPSPSCLMCFPGVTQLISRQDGKKAGNASLEVVSGEPPLW